MISLARAEAIRRGARSEPPAGELAPPTTAICLDQPIGYCRLLAATLLCSERIGWTWHGVARCTLRLAARCERHPPRRRLIERAAGALETGDLVGWERALAEVESLSLSGSRSGRIDSDA